MAKFGKIDNPAEASFEAWPEEEKGLGQKFGDLALRFGSLTYGPARIAKMLKDQFFTPNRIDRIHYLLDGIRMQLKILETQIGSAHDQTKAVEGRLNSPQFSEAVAAAYEEAARATNERKIEQLSTVIVGSLIPGKWGDPSEDIGVLIRDIAQLGDRDLKVLGMLATVHATAIATAPNLYEPDAFSRETAALMRDVASSGIHLDDFLSTCERLRGFGLAAEVPRNTSHMAPHDYCYRPTRRGLAVLSYLEGAKSASASSS